MSRRTDDLLEGIIQKMGGEVVEELTDKKKVIQIILRSDDSQDT